MLYLVLLTQLCIIVAKHPGSDPFYTLKLLNPSVPKPKKPTAKPPLLLLESNVTTKPSLDLAQLTSTSLRRDFIRNMTLEAWTAYTRHAWGQASLKPVTLSKQKGWLATAGTTIVASLSTLWTMGLKDEFDKARAWVQDEMVLDERGLVKIGALLSVYSLTGDGMFLEKAIAIADRFNVTGMSF